MKKAGVIILSMMMVAILTVTNMSGAYQAASVIYAAEDGNAGSEEKQEETPDAGGAASEETPDNTEVQRKSPENTQGNQQNGGMTQGEPSGVTTVLSVDGNDTSTPGGANTPGPGEDEQQNTPAPSVMLTLPAVDEDNLKTPEQARIAPAPQVFTVTFDANGHGSAPAAVSVETGKSIVKPDEPVAEGFTFCGWFRDEAATVLWNFDSDVVSENITLYAGWTENAPDSTTRLPENPNEENELVTNGEGEHGNAPVEGGNEPGNHAEESNIVSTPVSNGENIVPTDTTNEEESTTTQDALNITGASESGQEASALQTSTMLRSAAPVLKAPLQNSGLRAGQTVYLDLKYEGDGEVVASKYNGTVGTTVEITALPSNEYRFKNWEIVSGTGSIGAVNNNVTTFTMGTTDATVKAFFEILPAGENSLACIVDDGGTASATADPNYSSAYTLQATPASGYQFGHWSIIQGGGIITDEHKASTMITNCSGSVVVEANFSTITYPINTNANPSEGGSAECLPYYGGPAQNVNLTATPNAGYAFKEWKIISGTGTIRNPNDANTVLEDITGSVTCEAAFEAVPTGQYGVRLTKNYNWGGEATASVSYGETGTKVGLTATPASGYVFRRWEVEQGNVAIDSPDSAITAFNIGSEPVVVKAVFIPVSNDHSISTIAEGCGKANTNNHQGESGSFYGVWAHPDTGWSFSHWEVVSGGVTIDNEYAKKAGFVMRDQDVVVRAVFVPEQTNLLMEIKVTNPPKKDTYTAGESFDPDGMVVTAYYQNGTTDVSGYTYEPSGALAETDTLITIRYTINGVTKETTLPITVSPRPAPAKYIISVNASPSNGGKVTGGGTYADGDDVTVKASANTGYTFKHWTENGSVVSSNATYEFKATAARNLTAVFESAGTPTPQPAVKQYSVTVKATQGGTVTGGGSYEENKSVSVTATANNGYRFVHWAYASDPKTAVSVNTTYTFTAKDISLIAVFAPDSLYYTEGGNGTWKQGSTSDLRFKTNGTYELFTHITVDGKVVAAKDYEAESGSTIIRVKAAFLATLSAGTHTLETFYTNGTSIKTQFEIVAAGGTNPANPGNGTPTAQPISADGQNASENTNATVVNTNALGARSTGSMDTQNARMAQTGDDMYERLGLHTLVLLAALLLLIAQLRKLMDENKLLAISASCSIRRIPDSSSGNQKRKSRVKRTESGLEFIVLDAGAKRKPLVKCSNKNDRSGKERC